MSPLHQRLLRNPVFLVGFAAFLAALLVQSGELGSIDTVRRLQTTHSFWTSAPPVVPDDYPDFGIPGRNGRIYAWYGIGQSLLMLPADIVGTNLADNEWFEGFSDHDPGIREIVVSYSTNILLCVLAVLVCLRFLRLLEFTNPQAIAGAFTLLFGTTFLHYTQNMMENNFLMLFTLTALCFQYEWLRTGRIRPLLLGCLAAGANLLTRLTAALDISAVFLFLVLTLWFENVRGRPIFARLRSWALVAAPCYAGFLLLDRLYQFYRFGSFFTTYLTVFAAQQRKLDPGLPPDFPWSTPLGEGLLGPLVTPEKSIFLFDPLLLLTFLLSLLIWKRFRPAIKAYLLAGLWLLVAYIFFYARYYVWSGDFAWGDRYVTTPVELLAMISVPLLLRHRAAFGRILWKLGLGIVFLSVAVQLASVVFWHPLELQQMDTLGHPTFVVGLRFKNIAAVALGKADQWGLRNATTREAGGIHSGTPYFLPFLLKKDSSVSPALAAALIVAWLAALAALLALLLFIWRKASRGHLDNDDGSHRPLPQKTSPT